MARKVKWVVLQTQISSPSRYEYEHFIGQKLDFLEREKIGSCPHISIGYISKNFFCERCNFEGEDAKPHRSFVNHEEVERLDLHLHL